MAMVVLERGRDACEPLNLPFEASVNTIEHSCLIFYSRVARFDTTEMVNYGGGMYF